MPICDGAKCSTGIPWRITTSGLQLNDKTESFSVAYVKEALQQVLKGSYGGCAGVSPGVRNVVFKSLCAKCWQAQAGRWGSAGTYSDARAKTDSSGLYFQVQSPAFMVNHRPSPEIIFSCVCHELMHFWSWNAQGLQDFNRTLNVDWDEAVADLLGYLTYSRTFRGRFKQYVTPYNQYPTCIERAGVAFMSTPTYKWRRFLEGGAYREALPLELREFFSVQGNGASTYVLKQKAAQIVRELTFESLVTWFFMGPHTRVRSLGANLTCRRFLSLNGIQRMINTSTAFPAYAGGETSHPV